MLFNCVGTVHTHLTQEQRNAGLARRAEWKYPTGVKVHHEIWRPTAPHVISTFECDGYEAIMAIQLAWQDFMEMSFAPCTTPEEGLQTGAKLLGKK
jgi:hypothetical protein